MKMIDIILEKRYGHELTDEMIDYFVRGVTDETIPDYQISALLMAIVLNGMTDREMTSLTLKMAHSGQIMDLSFLDSFPVDKHSTGGVGDKITPLVLPLCATFGVDTVKLSGRGLGFTGGTLDKFESIEGFNINIDPSEFPTLIKRCGMVISGQTPKLAPADKVLYALRDVTGTVDSIPLIASSIMSKKIAGGAKGIVLDVTCGHGSFMKDIDDARKLARAMIGIGKLAGIRTVAVITDMDQPLGRTCGNTLEMKEVMETLIGKGSSDVIEVASRIAAEMVMLAGVSGMNEEQLYEECKKRIGNGDALGKYIELIASQGGKIDSFGNPVYKEQPFEEIRVPSPADGYVTAIRADEIGRISVRLGAGRILKTDQIDYGAGLCFYKKVGDKVERGDILCSICRGEHSDIGEEVLFDAMECALDAYEIGDTKPQRNNAVIDIIR